MLAGIFSNSSLCSRLNGVGSELWALAGQVEELDLNTRVWSKGQGPE
jgi:hypothetical protein